MLQYTNRRTAHCLALLQVSLHEYPFNSSPRPLAEGNLEVDIAEAIAPGLLYCVRMHSRRYRSSIGCLSRLGLSVLLLTTASCAQAQLGLGSPADHPANPTTLLTDPTDTPGVRLLFDLEARFARATAEGGGAAFASWFASDAVSLSNGKAPVQGQDAIAAQATWSPKAYQLTWIPDGGQMGTAGDMGYTWGHYSGHATDAAGAPIVTTGRYITVWKRQRDGSWKVIMDASNEGPALDCCKVP